jgi:hypothetical protein
VLRPLLSPGPQVRLGLNGDDLGHRGRVVAEVHAVAGHEHDDAAAADALEELGSVLGRAQVLGRRSDPLVQTGEIG